MEEQTSPVVPSGHAPQQGELQAEYSFELILGSTPPRKVVVKIPDLEAALAQRAERSTQLVAGINAFLESQHDPAAFNALPEQERTQRMADVAFDFASDQNPSAPDSVKWVVAADALSRVGLPSTATAALQKAESGSPQLAQSATVRNLASIIAGQSGKGNVRRDWKQFLASGHGLENRKGRISPALPFLQKARA